MVNDETRIAAEEAFARWHRMGTRTLADCLRAALEAAAPLIAAAEQKERAAWERYREEK